MEWIQMIISMELRGELCKYKGKIFINTNTCDGLKMASKPSTDMTLRSNHGKVIDCLIKMEMGMKSHPGKEEEAEKAQGDLKLEQDRDILFHGKP